MNETKEEWRKNCADSTLIALPPGKSISHDSDMQIERITENKYRKGTTMRPNVYLLVEIFFFKVVFLVIYLSIFYLFFS